MPTTTARIRRLAAFFVLFNFFAEVVSAAAPASSLAQKQIRPAIQPALQLLEKSAAEYPNQRTCFSCHHQTLPMQALVLARDHGIPINEELFRNQTKLTHETFSSRRANLEKGTGIGGKSMTVAFGLWALDLGGWPSDSTTSAMIAFLLQNQEKDGHFASNLDRPPLEDSIVTSTTLAAYYMQKFAGAEQKPAVERAVSSAQAWLIDAPTRSQEDRNFKLWGLHLLQAGRERVEQARQAVLGSQRPDGGWGQLAALDSDAYATGQTLFVLHQSGTATTDPAYQRGVRFLLETQLPDGSWRVRTRSKPIQVFFESGFPHGDDQFISICATSWAVAALTAATSPESGRDKAGKGGQ